MYRTLSEQVGAAVVDVPSQNWQMDRRAFLERAAQARVTWVCNPNNPSGELLPLEFLDELAQQSAGLVVVDEAYYEFTGVTATALIAERPNLVVVRTLSKAFGLAGARVGYAISSPDVATTVAKVRPPGSVSSMAAALGVLALGDEARMRQRVTELGVLRESLAADLEQLGWRVRRTPANFVLVAVSPGLVPELALRGMVLRSFAPDSSMAGWARVTVRAADENARLVDTIRQGGFASAG
jgi:histidinol-phosphate aminotransferase